jgi:phosphoribosylaminoimidazolecarboxamide formyltransferase / IMP cyclohydrolase
MSIRDNPWPVLDLILPRHVLVSVFDKKGLPELIREIRATNNEVIFYSTGGTGKVIKEVLGEDTTKNYLSIEELTRAPEMEGGLVKTLHPTIHAGLLAERGNPGHEEYLANIVQSIGSRPGAYFDVMIAGLYPFEQIIAEPGVTPETARGNIDIGGPTMVRAAAKNWHSVAVLVHPAQYRPFFRKIRQNKGTTLHQRFELAQHAFSHIASYDLAIENYFRNLDFERDVLPTLNRAPENG